MCKTYFQIHLYIFFQLHQFFLLHKNLKYRIFNSSRQIDNVLNKFFQKVAKYSDEI